MINRFLAYPEESAGSVMTSEFASVNAEMTVSEAIEKIRSTGYEKETIYVIYVTDNTRVLLGSLDLRDLLLSRADSPIGDIMDTSVKYASTLDDKESVAALISKYDPTSSS